MKVVDPGHVYDLAWLDGPVSYQASNPDRLVFVKREGPGYPGNSGHHPGTTMQEVLRAIIHRLKYVDAQIPDDRNETALGFLRLAMFNLEHRAAERHGRTLDVDIIPAIEDQPTCPKCLHIGCVGECHP